VSLLVRVLGGAALERRAAGLPNVGERLDPDRGEQGRTVRGPLLAIDPHHGEPVHVRLHAANEGASRPPAREEHLIDRDAEVAQNGERVAQREADAFDDRSRQMGARVGER